MKHPFSQRELQVQAMIELGATTKEMAIELGISRNTIAAYRASIRAKRQGAADSAAYDARAKLFCECGHGPKQHKPRCNYRSGLMGCTCKKYLLPKTD